MPLSFHYHAYVSHFPPTFSPHAMSLPLPFSLILPHKYVDAMQNTHLMPPPCPYLRHGAPAITLFRRCHDINTPAISLDAITPVNTNTKCNHCVFNTNNHPTISSTPQSTTQINVTPNRNVTVCNCNKDQRVINNNKSTTTTMSHQQCSNKSQHQQQSPSNGSITM